MILDHVPIDLCLQLLGVGLVKAGDLQVGEVRYVLVPFHDDSEFQAAFAARAVADTALNPNGKG